ncbi:ABC transporter permease [Ruminiclostridium cellobioparum]|uniref:ABC-type nitrate/sulfonate/bicarbonate transport system, permease component n=1 Tax=Ruminiclostridium cellobioparum subsp. termitidis CT1112 TaxID=1195236 RepID=S0FN19_RUMCE|nr:ABC transporter permease [Ruminiclostridium cellobioparum]EMS71756.1 ABC-type nitrate/sulfonate/bicarbonate transport system, permease component [Ruminiclostridium cellobioparum subsp. termitidis CT1112]
MERAIKITEPDITSNEVKHPEEAYTSVNKEPEALYSTGNNVKRTVWFLAEKGILTWLLLFSIWGIASLAYTVDFLPSPFETIAGAKEIILDGTLIKFILISSQRVLSGWGLGILFAIPVGLVIGRIELLRRIFEPFIDFLRFIPAIGFLTLFLMWFGAGEKSKIILIFYATVFVILINTIVGVLSIDKNRLQAARSLGASEFQIIYSVLIPSALPHIFTGIRLGLGGAFTSIVAAEMLAAKEGIGFLIYTSRLYFRTDWIFVGLLTLGLMGYISDRLIRLFGKIVLGRYGINDTKKFD